MEEERPDRLYSWKEIAAYLDVSVRTAQLWEKQRGLPVHRLPGGQRRRPYALVSELEVWLEDGRCGDDGGGSREPSGSGASLARTVFPRITSRTLAAVATSALIIVAAGSLATWAGDMPEPASWAVRGSTLVIYDAGGQELWRKEFSAALRRSRYDRSDSNLRPPVFTDIDGDGAVEVLFAAYFEDRGRSSLLTAYDTDGTELWVHRPGQSTETETESFEDVYLVGAVRPLPQPDGTQDLIVSAHHYIFYPSLTTRLSSTGALKARYFHPGHVGTNPRRLLVHDLDGDGREEVLLTGVDNARERATLVILDPDRMAGAARVEDRDYRFQGVQPAKEIARIFFPRSSVTPDSERFTVGQSLRHGRSSLTVAVLQATMRTPAEEVLYTFGPDLDLLRVSPGDHFLGRFRQLTEVGLITRSLEEELSRLGQIEIVRPPEQPPAGPGATDTGI